MPRLKSPSPIASYHPSETWPEGNEQSASHALRAFVGGVFIVVWIVALGLIIAGLMTGHWVVLPHPEVGESLTPTEPEFSGSADAELTALHFLYADCPCSRRVLNHVLDRQTIAGVCEKIVLIGDDHTIRGLALSSGYQFEAVAADELKAQYGVEAAPLLVVTDPKANIVYSGGYTTRKQGPAILDVATITALTKGKSPACLPVYGCAVSQELQALVDPFGLKY